MAPDHEPHLLNLRSVVRSNLQYQHYWTDLTLLDTLADIHSNDDGDNAQLENLPWPMIYGRPPDQLYDPEHAASNASGTNPKPTPELEYVLPVHLDEKFTLRKWAAVFDALPKPCEDADSKKRIVVAVVSGDSTVVYYIMHDGIVKPRQN
ncbi:hypothetical protein TWF696_002440 [Orbilia brochopaga]|uniref:tRNA-splicing endonuclease subunit Sen15 domain-containing protein n=1 Tax=Orbilia brochopaga TaxID=3140254 RepID=A0AAV9U490_9PEZI